MEADNNFNLREAAVVDVDAYVVRKEIAEDRRYVILNFRRANSRHILRVRMTDKEAVAMAAQLYANSDRTEKERPVYAPDPR